MCRATRRGGQFKLFKNKQIERDVWSLQIFCTNKEKGCEWQGELNTFIKDHLKPGNVAGCQYENVKCTNGCGEMMQRRHFTCHMKKECSYRMVKCVHCHYEGKQKFIYQEHMQQCPKLPLPCPNKCTVESVCRDNMDKHRNQCPLEIVQCEYGCPEKMPRKDLSLHNESNLTKHLAMACMQNKTATELTAIKSELAAIKSEMATITQKFQQLTIILSSFQPLHGGYYQKSPVSYYQ